MAAQRYHLESLQKLWESGKQNLSTEEINKLFVTYNKRKLVLHVVTENGSSKGLENVNKKKLLTGRKIISVY